DRAADEEDFERVDPDGVGGGRAGRCRGRLPRLACSPGRLLAGHGTASRFESPFPIIAEGPMVDPGDTARRWAGTAVLTPPLPFPRGARGGRPRPSRTEPAVTAASSASPCSAT